MKPAGIRLVKIMVLISGCASVAYVAHVVTREAAYLHTKINRSKSIDTAQQELRWPDNLALPELRVSAYEQVEDHAGCRSGSLRTPNFALGASKQAGCESSH